MRSREPKRRPIPYLSGINIVPLPVGTVGKLPHYSSISGSCNVAGAPVATVSPGEFVPVWSKMAGGLFGLALPLMSKFP